MKHPFITNALTKLILNSSPADLIKTFSGRYAGGLEIPHGARCEPIVSGGRRMGLDRPMTLRGFNLSSGYNGIKRRVVVSRKNLEADWRNPLIDKLNEVLMDAQRREEAAKIREQNADVANKKAFERRDAVRSHVGPMGAHINWFCESRGAMVNERLVIDTSAMPASQIKRIIEAAKL